MQIENLEKKLGEIKRAKYSSLRGGALFSTKDSGQRTSQTIYNDVEIKACSAWGIKTKEGGGKKKKGKKGEARDDTFKAQPMDAASNGAPAQQ
uniref:ERBB-3 BINDING PROTEIN 1-like n=1 Tax=Elaeis guineensis var. tenera TaxID=51953 RepID=A0A8N4IE15_ELAGV|nr:ERBB-3 BINDING PROTEIN 1-like [Elaeis guineensis]